MSDLASVNSISLWGPPLQCQNKSKQRPCHLCCSEKRRCCRHQNQQGSMVLALVPGYISTCCTKQCLENLGGPSGWECGLPARVNRVPITIQIFELRGSPQPIPSPGRLLMEKPARTMPRTGKPSLAPSSKHSQPVS